MWTHTHRKLTKKVRALICKRSFRASIINWLFWLISVSDKPVTRKDKKKKKKIAPQPPNKRSIGLQTENRNNNDNNYVSMNLHQQSKKTYLFSTSSNEMAFPNSMPAQMMNRRNEASLDNLWWVFINNFASEAS